MIVITMAGEKGGIGKTTLTFHLACYLAEQGRRVLAVDLDPQGSLTYTQHALEKRWSSTS